MLADPSTIEELMTRHRLPMHLAALTAALARSSDPADQLRAQCAFGAITAPIIGPLESASARTFRSAGARAPRRDRGRGFGGPDRPGASTEARVGRRRWQ
jgi:hypothetical protein